MRASGASRRSNAATVASQVAIAANSSASTASWRRPSSTSSAAVDRARGDARRRRLDRLDGRGELGLEAHDLRLVALEVAPQPPGRGAVGRRDGVRHGRRRLGRRRPRPALGLLARVERPIALVVDEAAVGDLPDAGREPGEEAAVVGDEDDGALVRRQRRLERLDHLDVEVVRRLVEHEHVGLDERQLEERQARPLPTGEVGDALELRLVREEEAAEQVVGADVAHHLVELLEERRLRIDAGEVLIVVGHPYAGPPRDPRAGVVRRPDAQRARAGRWSSPPRSGP